MLHRSTSVRLMRNPAVLLSMALAAVWLFAASCGGGAGVSYENPGAGSLTDSRDYSSGDFAALRPSATVKVASAWPSLAVGDVHGGDADEVLLVEDGTTRVLDSAGAEVSRIEHEDALTAAFVTDVTGDGKGDVVYGARGAGAALVAAYDGRGNLVTSATMQAMIRGITRPVCFADGRIYFAAHSEYNVAPKIVGSVDPSGRSAERIHHTGPLPIGLSVASDGKLAISTRGLGRERSEVAVPYDTAYDRNAVLVLDTDGSQVLYETIGPPVEEGYITENAVSGVVSKFCDVNGDDADELIVLVERVSGLYDGPAELRVVSLDGAVLSELEGPRRTDGDFGFYGDKSSLRIVVVWSRTGEVVLLDGELQERGSAAIGPSPHDLRLHAVGDFNGDGRANILLSDQTRLYVLDDELEVVWDYPVEETIRDVKHLRGAEGRFAIAVLAHDLHLFAPAEADPGTGTLEIYTDPPGADVVLDGVVVDGMDLPVLTEVAAGAHTVQARIAESVSEELEVEVQAGRNTRIVMEVPTGALLQTPQLRDPYSRDCPPVPERPVADYGDFEVRLTGRRPEGLAGPVLSDYLAAPGLELLFYDQNAGTFRILDNTLKPIRTGRLPVRNGRPQAPVDLNADGYADISPLDRYPIPSVTAVTADGRLVADAPVCLAFDTGVSIMGIHDDTVFLSTITAYLLAPRGIHALNRRTWELQYFYPAALMVNQVQHHDGLVYVGSYTASNGAEYVHANGYVERDTEIFLHVIDQDGEMHESARPLPGDDTDGGSTFFTFDSDGDGRREVYVLIGKDQSYYTGRPDIYRFHRDGRLELVYSGPANQDCSMRVFGHPGAERLSIRWKRSPQVHEIIEGADWNVVYRRELPRNEGVGGLVNLDGDEAWEIIERKDGVVRVLDLDRRVRAEYAIPGEQETGIRIRDLDFDGTTELLLLGRETMQVLGY